MRCVKVREVLTCMENVQQTNPFVAWGRLHALLPVGQSVEYQAGAQAYASYVGLANTVCIRVINMVALHYYTQYIRVIDTVLANPTHMI